MKHILKRCGSVVMAILATIGVSPVTGITEPPPPSYIRSIRDDEPLYLQHTNDYQAQAQRSLPSIESMAHGSHSSHSSHASHASHYSSSSPTHYSSAVPAQPTYPQSPTVYPEPLPAPAKPPKPDMPNYAPTACDVQVATDENNYVMFNFDASDKDSDDLTYKVISSPKHGKLSGLNSSVGVYTPEPGFSGEDSFTYKVSDGKNFSSIATVYVKVKPIQHIPKAQDTSVTTLKNCSRDFALGVKDAGDDKLSYSIITQPKHGKLSGEAPFLSYTPSLDYVGTDVFQFTVDNGKSDPTSATVTITVRAENKSPVAIDKKLAITGNISAEISLDANDRDVDTLTYDIVIKPKHGKLSGTLGLSRITYIPDTGYKGGDSFTFKVSDGFVESNIATVAILVEQ